MLKCKNCNRQTPKGEPTGKFTIYRQKIYDVGVIGKEATSELNVCNQCLGERLIK